jgi:cyclin-A
MPEDESRVLEQATVAYDLDETMRSQRDPLLFRDYAADVMEHFKELEQAHPVAPDYLERAQEEVDEGKRAILVDWLVEVVEEYRLMPETLFMAVQYVDRYLSAVPVSRAELQLVGIAAMVLAGKMEEIWMPSLDDFINISDNTYSREAIIDMEARIAVRLGFRLKAATAKTFMHRFLRAAGAARGDNQTALVKYLAEITLPETRFLAFRPSVVCAAAVLVARRIERIEPEWSPTLRAVTGYDLPDLEPCALQINVAHRETPFLVIRAIFDKYSHSPYNHVAREARPLLADPDEPMPGTADEPTFGPLLSSARTLTSNTY